MSPLTACALLVFAGAAIALGAIILHTWNSPPPIPKGFPPSEGVHGCFVDTETPRERFQRESYVERRQREIRRVRDEVEALCDRVAEGREP